MSQHKICRICLCKGVKMYSFNEYDLKWYYEEVMAKRVFNDGLPHHVCYLCAAMLNKFHKFKKKCFTGEDTLKSILLDGPITLNSISQSDRQNKNLISPIAIITASKKVKTYRVKSETLLHSSEPEIIFENVSKSESIEKITENLDQYDAIDLITTDDNKDLFQIDDNNMKVEEDININDNNSQNEVFAEAIAAVIADTNNTFLDDDCGMSDDNFLSDLVLNKYEDKTEETPNLVIDEDTQSKTTTKPNKRRTSKEAVKDKHIPDKTKTTNKRSRKSVADKSEKKPATERKRFPGGKQNHLDPQHWLKTQLTEVEALEEHNAKGKDPKYLAAPYKCVDCLKGFSKEEMVTRHRKMRHDESIGNIVCRFCNRRFRVNYQLTNHIILHYSRYKCLRCNLTFNREGGANFHNDYHNGVTRKCEHCGEEFRHASTYYTHLRMMHRSEHICTLCGESFVSDAGLKYHKHIRHTTTVIDPADQVNIHCERCDIMFETRKAYDEHMIHSKMHSDGLEDEAFETGGLKKGPRKIAKIPSQCEVCLKNFDTRKAYIKHFGEEHPGLPSPIYKIYKLNQRVVCEICGQSVALAGLSTHKNRHTREKMVKCATCGMEFTTKSALKIHLVKHTGEKPYKCTLCDKRFTQSGSMGLHYRTYHLKEPYPKRNRGKKVEDQFMLDYYRDDDSDGCLQIVE